MQHSFSSIGAQVTDESPGHSVEDEAQLDSQGRQSTEDALDVLQLVSEELLEQSIFKCLRRAIFKTYTFYFFYAGYVKINYSTNLFNFIYFPLPGKIIE